MTWNHHIAARQPAPHQLYQSNPPYRGYQRGNKKGVYQVSGEKADPHLEGFYTTLEHKGKDVQYLDERFNKVDANFVGIETSYRKCGVPFSSKSRLHRHFKDGCISFLQHSLPSAPFHNLIYLYHQLKVRGSYYGLRPSFSGVDIHNRNCYFCPSSFPLLS